MKLFLYGAFAMGALLVSLYFLRFWTRTREKLFLIFSSAFFLLAVERVLLALWNPPRETQGYYFLSRLMAFLLIIYGVLDKNRSGRPAA